jgi:hypothetical protein
MTKILQSKEEASDNYLRELKSHANTVSILESVKKELLSFKMEKEKVEGELTRMTSQFSLSEAAWNEKKASLEAQVCIWLNFYYTFFTLFFNCSRL